MKLTKIELTEGIKLSEVGDKEDVYQNLQGRLSFLWPRMGCTTRQIEANPAWHLCIIRDNKVIDIIKDEEYNNDKPYIIKYGDRILGFIEVEGKEQPRYYTYISTNTQAYSDYNLNKLISRLNKDLLEVYKQE